MRMDPSRRGDILCVVSKRLHKEFKTTCLIKHPQIIDFMNVSSLLSKDVELYIEVRGQDSKRMRPAAHITHMQSYMHSSMGLGFQSLEIPVKNCGPGFWF